MTGWVEAAYSQFCLENFLELDLIDLRPVFPCDPQVLAVVGGNLRGQFTHRFGEFEKFLFLDHQLLLGGDGDLLHSLRIAVFEIGQNHRHLAYANIRLKKCGQPVSLFFVNIRPEEN